MEVFVFSKERGEIRKLAQRNKVIFHIEHYEYSVCRCSNNGHNNNNNKSTATAGEMNKYADVQEASTLKDKIIAILRIENRFLHVRQFAEILHSLNAKISEDDYRAKVSTTLSLLRAESNVVNFSVHGANANTFWGSKNWLESKDTPKPEYMYDEKYIKVAGKRKDIVI